MEQLGSYWTEFYDIVYEHILCSITAFSWKQWLRERASMLNYTYIVCLVIKR